MEDKKREEWIEKKAKILAKHLLLDLDYYKNFIRTLLNEAPKPKVSREWVYYFCAYINAGHKSPADDKARVEHAIKKLKEAGFEVEG